MSKIFIHKPPTIRRLRQWLSRAKVIRKNYMMVVHDGTYNEYYPMYFKSKHRTRNAYNSLRNRMGMRIVEVYSLEKDITAQLKEDRALHLD